MLEKTMSGAPKRASLEKQLEAFKECAKEIVNNALEEKDNAKFKPGTLKKPRLRNRGITTRVATISSNVNISEQAKIEVAKNILKMQKDYSKKKFERVINCVKIDKLLEINTKGKPKWTAGVGKSKQHIFYNVSNEEVDVENVIPNAIEKGEARGGLEPEDNKFFCGNCNKETKASSKSFALETLDAKIMCSGCKKTQSIQKWNCKCDKPWHECVKHKRVGEILRRIKAKSSRTRRGQK